MIVSQIDLLLETTKQLSQQINQLQNIVQEPKKEDHILQRIQYLEDDFLFTHERNQEFHESFTTTVSHFSHTITQFDTELRDIESQIFLMKKYIRILEKRNDYDNRFYKEQIDMLIERITKLESEKEESELPMDYGIIQEKEKEKKENSSTFMTAKQVFEARKKI